MSAGISLRPLRVKVTKGAVILEAFHHREAGRFFRIEMRRDQGADLAQMLTEAIERDGAREFLLGFTPETLAFHKLDAVPLK